MNYKSFIIERKEAITLISINRPEKGNSISNLLIDEFIDFFSKPYQKVGLVLQL